MNALDPAAAPTVVTFGCRLNFFESEAIRAVAAGRTAPGTIVVNTCAVTAEAERQARQAIRRLRREHPEARLVVTGCAAQLHPERFGAMAEVDQVLGNAEKLRPESYGAAAPVLVGDIMAVEETAPHLVPGFAERSRAFIEIQQGCDHRCTFCIIPFARGRNRSTALGPLVEQVRALVERGFREVVLTGVDIASHGADLPGGPSLGETVTRLLAQIPDLPRLRLSSLDPVLFARDPALWRLIEAEERFLPHLHLSVQAGDDMILKRMKRRHDRAEILAVAHRARALRPNIAIGADMIAGFPTEDEAMFENGLALVEEAGLTHLHVFPFSARPGTPAARMPKLPADVVKDRAARLRRAGDAARAAYLARQIGREVSVLIERDGGGHSETFLPVRLIATEALPGSIVRGTVTGIEGDGLVAVAA